MNQLTVISGAGLREAEFYGDFIELYPGAGWQSSGKRVFGGGIYTLFTVFGGIHPEIDVNLFGI